MRATSNAPRNAVEPLTTTAHRRILHVAAPGNFGGLERVIHSLAAHQRERGIDARVALLVEANIELPDLVAELRGDGVPVHLVTASARSYVRQWRALRSLLESEQPDVVHSHGYVSDVLTSFAAFRGTAVIATVHGFTGGDWKNRTYEWMQCRALRSFDAVVAVSRQLAEDLTRRGIAESRIEVVPNGGDSRTSPMSRDDARNELAIPASAFSVGWVGRLSREKGLDVLIEALPALRDMSPRLTIIGSGPERKRLERRVAELEVGHMVCWAGAIPRAGRLMPAFDVLVNSSRTEGTPMTLLEAMAAHVPMVATAVGGVPDVLTDNEAIVVPAERPDDLAMAVRRVHDDRTSASDRATAARARLVDRFAVGPWVDAYERVYTRAQQVRTRRKS